MADYPFKASSTTQSAKWNNPSSWVNGVVPNAPDADVIFPLVVTTSTGRAYLTDVSIGSGENFSVHTVQLNDVLDVNGSLSVASDMTNAAGSLNVAGNLTIGGTFSDQNGFTTQVLSGGTLSAQTINTGPGQIYGSGQVTAGTLNNTGSVSASIVNATTLQNSGTLGGYNNSAITATTLTNTGKIEAINSTTSVNVTPGGFTNLAAGTLTGGTYDVEGGGSLSINAGGVITTDAANITLQAGGTSLTSHDPVTGQDVTLTNSLHAIAPTGSLTVWGDAGFGALNVAGMLEIDSTQLTSTQLSIASGGTLDSFGTSAINSPVANSGVIIASDEKLTLNGDVTGAGHLEVAANGTLVLNDTTSQTVVFDASLGGRFSSPAVLQINTPSNFTGSLTPSGVGDKIVIPNVSASSIASYSYAGSTTGGTLTLQEQNGGALALNFNGNFTTSDFHVSAGPQNLSIDPPSLLITVGVARPVCFLAGTRILTPQGETAVEQLRVGDKVVTSSGEVKAIVWIGSGIAHDSSARAGSRAVVVRAGALDEGVPCRDLRVTEGHSLYLDGVLIPAAMLINGLSIAWDRDAEQVTFYHVELSDHDILVADGALAESYRDDGNRRCFDCVTSEIEGGIKQPYAPVLSEGAVVDAVWRRIVERAAVSRNLTDDPDLHLLVDGVRLDPVEIDNTKYRFISDSNARSVMIGSHTVVPALVGTARDHRRLGVAIREIAAIAPEGTIRLDYAADLLATGFHEAEPDGCLRWTNGAAELPIGALNRGSGFAIELTVACFAQYEA